MALPADVAQLVEHITRNDGVRGSNPRVGSPDLQGVSLCGHGVIVGVGGYQGATRVKCSVRLAESDLGTER
jgi:hypothetical protein